MRVTLLGSASALSTAERDTTSMVVQVNEDLLLIDCSGSPVKKLLQLEQDYTRIDNILLTHWHPDHVYGLPSLLHEMLLLGRKRKLNLFLPRASQRIIQPFVQALFVDIPNMFEIEYRPLDRIENLPVFEKEEYRVYSTPVLHSHDTLAYKVVEVKRSDTSSERVSFVYSSDTKPTETLVRLAQGTDLLIHECTYLDGEPGAVNTTHSTARQAGAVAAEAHVKQLVLVHLGIQVAKNPEIALSQVQETYSGPVVVGEDMMLFQV